MSLRTENLSVGYNGRAILENINADVPAGAFAVLLGPNGSGKSTFLRAIAGTSSPVSGNIIIGGQPIRNLSPRQLARQLAMVFTDRNGGGMLTVREAVKIGRYPYTGLWGHLSADDLRKVDEAIEAVGMTDKAERYIGTLSDGERQKAMIARALAQDTPLIVLDEPTAFLDVAGRMEVLRLLANLAKNGKAILLSTHDIAPAMEQATHVLAIDPATHTMACGTKAQMIASGAIDKPFAANGMKFDQNINDFR